jgi:hypothetical protein
MTEGERRLQRQAEWQKSRQALPWPEKIRLAEQMRTTLEAFRAERQRRSAVGPSTTRAEDADQVRPDPC